MWVKAQRLKFINDISIKNGYTFGDNNPFFVEVLELMDKIEADTMEEYLKKLEVEKENMNKQVKTDYMVKGMVEDFKKKPNAKLLNQIIGLKFKNVRLNKDITAEAVVEDNPVYFNSIFDLYKFEKGIKTDVSKLFCLSKYYRYDITQLIERLN